jgi:hypothetical protein
MLSDRYTVPVHFFIFYFCNRTIFKNSKLTNLTPAATKIRIYVQAVP